ncbi:MAG: hypothetical protein ACX93O_03155 [Flagellimonas sp.]
MIGDFKDKMYDFLKYFKVNEIFPTKSKVAIDLGAGHEIQSLALARMGFDVSTVDLNKKLLNELKSNDIIQFRGKYLQGCGIQKVEARTYCLLWRHDNTSR